MSKRETTYKLSCSWCGEPFQASRLDAVYCSDRCRKADSREALQLDRLAARAMPAGRYTLILGKLAAEAMREELRDYAVTPQGKHSLKYADQAVKPFGISEERWTEISYGEDEVFLSCDEVFVINSNWPGAIQRALGIGSGGQRLRQLVGPQHGSGFRVVEKF